ncbi:MAG: hypothetical protein RDU30_15710 [Desulfovibrionaceae bacterium]|nr:hypothetical protein [Desulfovibrionaceae bacterium]
MASYIAYFDQLGVRDNARTNINDYYNGMIKFQKNILEKLTYKGFKSKIKLKHFSDCFFAESTDLKTLIDYMTEVRSTSISQGLYFKSAITSGKLLSVSASDDADSDKRAISASTRFLTGITPDTIERDFGELRDLKIRTKEDAEGILFLSPNVCLAVVLEDKFKGVGFSLDPGILQDARSKKLDVISSFYFDPVKRATSIHYDIKFTPDNLSEPSITNLLNNVLAVSIRSKKIALKYLSILASLINSEDYTHKFTTDQADSGYSPLINAIISMKTTRPRLYKNLPYIDLLFIKILDNYYTQNNPAAAEEYAMTIKKRFSIFSKYEGNFDSIPEYILQKQHVKDAIKLFF